MESIKQRLINDTIKELAEREEEIKKSDEELGLLGARLKVENKFAEMRDIPPEITEDVKYSVQALENMIVMEENRNAELKRDFEILRYRKQVINKFEDEEL